MDIYKDFFVICLVSRSIYLKADSIAEDCKHFEEENTDFLIMDEMEG